MNGLKTTKYMDLFSTLGILIAIPLMLWFAIFKGHYSLMLAGVVIVFASRGLGYFLDRMAEKKM